MAETQEEIKDIQTSTTIEVSETQQPEGVRLGVWGCLWGLITNQKDLIEYIDKVVENSTKRIEEREIEPIFENQSSQNSEISTNSISTQSLGTATIYSTPTKIVRKIIKK